MGPRQVAQDALFYEFSIEEFVPKDHPLRGIDRFLDLSDVRPLLASSYSSNGRPSIDPEVMIRMLLLGYCQGIRPISRITRRMRFSFTRWPSLRRCQVICGTPKNGVSRNCSSIWRISIRFIAVSPLGWS